MIGKEFIARTLEVMGSVAILAVLLVGFVWIALWAWRFAWVLLKWAFRGHWEWLRTEMPVIRRTERKRQATPPKVDEESELGGVG